MEKVKLKTKNGIVEVDKEWLEKNGNLVMSSIALTDKNGKVVFRDFCPECCNAHWEVNEKAFKQLEEITSKR